MQVLCLIYVLVIFSLCSLLFFNGMFHGALSFLSLMKSNLSFFTLCVLCFCLVCKKPLPNSRMQRFSPVFPSRHFIVMVLHLVLLPVQVNFYVWCEVSILFDTEGISNDFLYIVTSISTLPFILYFICGRVRVSVPSSPIFFLLILSHSIPQPL